MNNESLFNEFDATSAKAWKQQIQFDLKGADYNNSLVWDSHDGIKVKPFYHADDFEGRSTIGPDSFSQWFVGQNIYAGNAKIANKKALDALSRGAESIVFIVPSEDIKIDVLLENIDLTTTPLYFEFRFLSAQYIKQILDYVGSSEANIHLNIDIIGHLARTGNWFFTMEKDHEILIEILKHNSVSNIKNTLGVDVSLYQNAGANTVQQLAYALAHANEYLNFIKNQNIKPAETITFKVAVGSDYFFEISKLRALRLLWKTLASEYGIDAECHIITTPTYRNKTLYDANMNMLRTTTECMSAILGGANTICNFAFDGIFRKDNEFAERIARNQLLILKGECYFDKVNNASDGVYYIESLTQQLAESGLILFKNIEAGGGFLKQLKAHNIQKKIKESAQKEQSQFNNKEKILVGSNKYINELEKKKDELELYPFVKTKVRKTLLEPIVEKRLAEEVEKKRLQNE